MPAIPILKTILGRRVGFSTRTPSTASDFIVEGGIVTNNLSGNPVHLASATGGLQMPTAQPTAPAAGSMWFNTTTHVLQIYDGTVWRSSAAFT
jgi:hypothetical protein